MLQLSNIRKEFNHQEMLSNIDYVFETGQIYPIVGPHGSGKTLLCECIAGLCKPDGGRVYITGGQGASLIYEATTFPPYLTVYEYITTIAPENIAIEIMEKVDMPKECYYTLLRDCEQEVRKRLQMAVVLLKNPYVITMDSPFDFCSDDFKRDIWNILEELKDDHIVIVTSGKVNVARALSNDIVVLNNGELNLVDDASFRIPEIKRALEELLSEGEEDEIA